MIQINVNIPDGMSYVNAFVALWTASPRSKIFDDFPDYILGKEREIDTPQKVKDLLSRRKYIDYIGGRMMLVDFTNFPKVNVREYNRQLGRKYAEQVIREYALVPTEYRFDAGDMYRFEDIG